MLETFVFHTAELSKDNEFAKLPLTAESQERDFL